VGIIKCGTQIKPYQAKETAMLLKMIMSAAMVAGGAGIVRAAAQDDVQAAVQKLADSPNYSWKTTTEGGQGGQGASQTTGQTQKDGLTTLTITRQDNTFQVVIQGDKAAVKTDDGWQSAAELAAQPAGGNGGPPSPGRFLGMMARNFKTPVAVAQDAAGKLENLQLTDGVYTADLNADAAKAALTFRRRPNADDSNAPTVSNAKATIKIWIQDGAVSKIENHISGTVSFNGNDRDIDRTSTTQFFDVGTTNVTVPDDAKAKLVAPATQPAQ
jgi:hypothetical protein